MILFFSLIQNYINLLIISPISTNKLLAFNISEYEDDKSIILQKAPVVAVDLSQCNITYSTRSLGTKTIDRSQICAGTPSGRGQTDACWVSI